MAQPTQQHSSIRNGLLAALSPEDWAHLEPHLETVELPFDQTIFAAGGPVDAVFFVETGMVSLIVALDSPLTKSLWLDSVGSRTRAAGVAWRWDGKATGNRNCW